MALLVHLPNIADEAQEHWVQLVAAIVVAALALGAIRRFLPGLLTRGIRKLDDWVVGDLSFLDRPVAFLGTAFVSGWVIFGAGVAVANALGADTTGIYRELLAFGGAVGEFVAAQAVQVGIIVGIAYVAVQVVERAMPTIVRGVVNDSSRPDTLAEEVQKRETTLSSVIVGGFKWLIYLVAGFAILSEIGISIAPILAAAGVVGIAIGFGAQSLVKDVLSGVFIILEDQYRVGDVVNVAGKGGLVEDINLRRTIIRDLEFVVHVIPNGSIDVVSNLTKEKSRMLLDVPVAYKEDLDRCIEALNVIGEEMQKDEKWGPIITEQVTVLRVDKFDDSAINIRCLGQTLPIRQWEVAGEFRKRIKRRFDELGIEIPFPHQTIYWGVDQPPFNQPSTAAEGDSRKSPS